MGEKEDLCTMVETWRRLLENVSAEDVVPLRREGVARVCMMREVLLKAKEKGAKLELLQGNWEEQLKKVEEAVGKEGGGAAKVALLHNPTNGAD